MKQARCKDPHHRPRSNAAASDGAVDRSRRASGRGHFAVNRRAMKVHGKQDGSPVTEADLAADRIIVDGLAQIAPDVPTLSEERAQAAKPPFRESFFLDRSTRRDQGVRRGAHRVHRQRRAGDAREYRCSASSARLRLGWLWRGLVGRGAERLKLSETGLGAPEPIHTRRSPGRGEPWIAAVSRSHGDARTEAFIDARPGAVRTELGSAVKFGRLAEGAADIYPRLGADLGMGHRGRLRNRRRRRRQDHRRRWTPAYDLANAPKASSCRRSSPGAIRRRMRA